MKIKDRVLRLRTKATIWFTYLMLSRYQIWWNWRHIKKCYFRRFCDLSLFIEQRFEFIYGSILIRFSKWLIFLNNLERENRWNFPSPHKYINVLQLSTALYLVCKYLLALSRDSQFLLHISLGSFHWRKRKNISQIQLDRKLIILNFNN